MSNVPMMLRECQRGYAAKYIWQYLYEQTVHELKHTDRCGLFERIRYQMRTTYYGDISLFAMDYSVLYKLYHEIMNQPFRETGMMYGTNYLWYDPSCYTDVRCNKKYLMEAIGAVERHYMEFRKKTQEATEPAKQAAEDTSVIPKRSEEAIASQERSRAEHFFKDHLKEMLQESRDESLEANRPSEAEVRELEQARMDLLNNVAGESSRIQNALNTSFSQLKNDIEDQLIEWRKGLFQNDYKAEAEHYVELFRISNRLINRIAELGDSEENRVAVEILSKEKASLERVMKKLEKRMNAHGLSSFLVQPGELYNSEYHAETILAEEPENGIPITACSCPGVYMIDSTMGMTKICLCKASVTTSTAEDNDESMA